MSDMRTTDYIYTLPVRTLLLRSVIILGLGTIGCTPRVEIVPPEKPITINLNVKIDHEVRVKVDRDLDQVISKDSGLF